MAAAASADPRPSNRLLYAAMAMLLAASVGVQMLRDRGWAPFVPPNPSLWVQSGPLAGKLALGYDNLVADVYWMRAVVYYGGRRVASSGQQSAAARAANFDLLYPLLDLVTSLDPRFSVAYRFGAIFLAEPYPSGAGRADQAVELLQRAVEKDPLRGWEYMEDIGFIYYWWIRDYPKAADWFARAGKEPGAPSWLGPLAATTLSQGGDRASARFLWTQILDNADSDWLRTTATTRVRQLDAMDTIDDLNRRMAGFATREKRLPRTWREFVGAEKLRAMPVDPAGVPFTFDPASRTFGIDRKSPLWPLPQNIAQPAQAPLS
jgi:tetratricopeptide (TPR) repeat protein